MIARIYTKPQVQSMLKAMRKVKGFTVEKLKSGYKVTYKTVDGEDKLVFKAMNGHNSYLVRHAENLFV